MADSALILGLDTSNYTTSAALLTQDGELVANIKRPLPVREGAVGLRQSDAVFAHIKNLPSLMDEVKEHVGDRPLLCVGVSSRPRNVNGSYMPCFLVGDGVAQSIGALTHAPVYRFSHQCGHLMAALFSAGRQDLLSGSFAAFHVSGGTTDLLRVCAAGDGGFLCERVGGASDLHAGQVIDRVGVYMGLPFPSGASMEQAALACKTRVPRRKPAVNGMTANLSGLENMAKKLYDETHDPCVTAAFVLRYMADTLILLSQGYVERFGQTPFVYAGGVMSNSLLKAVLSERFDASFATPSMSSDNAVGIAALARDAHAKRTEK